ncbi:MULTISPECIES: Ni2+-binding GTPase [unclassified Paenibacillus]|uniref:Ni2+-binding GTPase n=1 Tax=unclassified Paenibacillus TaxID=185978 RepID=UPI0036BE125B
MAEQYDDYKERIAALEASGDLSEAAKRLLEEMLGDLAESNRSNKALRRVILKTGQSSTMSTRLREALYE